MRKIYGLQNSLTILFDVHVLHFKKIHSFSPFFLTKISVCFHLKSGKAPDKDGLNKECLTIAPYLLWSLEYPKAVFLALYSFSFILIIQLTV